MERTTETNMNVSSLINHTMTIGESVMVDNIMDEIETSITFKIANFLGIYWIPILVPIGLVGNTLSFLVMIKPNNRKMSTCNYMAAISINDNAMVIKGFHYWLYSIKVFKMSSIECKLADYFILLILQNGTYQVLAMTIDKYIAIKWPHKASIYSTPERARKTSIVIVICVFIYNIPSLFLSEIVGNECPGYAKGAVFTKIYSWFSFCVNAIIPFAMLIYMNCVIV